MDNKQKCALAIAVAASLGGAGVANASVYTATLISDTSFSANGSSAANISSSTATFQYDDVTTLLTQTGGTFDARFSISPTTILFRHTINDLVIGNGAAALASSYNCAEGNFGGIVGASLCGNYNFGVNFANESTSSWGPGVAFTRAIGGDDMSVGPQQSIAAYDSFTQSSFVGSTLTLSNATATSGYTFVLNTAAVPVPAAVWLFGSALGLLGAARRRTMA